MAERSDFAIWTSHLRQAVWSLALSGELYTNPQLYPGVTLAERSDDGLFDVLTITKGPITASFYRFATGDLGPIGLTVRVEGEEKPYILDNETMLALPTADFELLRALFWPYIATASKPSAAINKAFAQIRQSMTDAYIAEMRKESEARTEAFRQELLAERAAERAGAKPA